MTLGPIFALLSAAIFAVAQVLIRRGVYQAEESSTGAAISVFIGTPTFLLIFPFTANWDRLWFLSWQGFILLGTVGIIQFVLGRYLLFSGIRLIGANKTGAIVRTNTLFAVFFAVIFLHESLTPLLILGILCIMFGAGLVSFERGESATRLQAKGVLFGLGSALSTGLSTVLIKSAMAEVNSPYVAAFVSYIVAFFLWAILLFHQRQRNQLLQLPRSSLIILSIAGIFALVGQLLKYAALNYSPVSVVQPLLGTIVLFILFFSFIVNRDIDVFTWRIFTGILVVATGTFLLFT